MIRKREKSVVGKVHGLEEEREFDWLGDSEFLAEMQDRIFQVAAAGGISDIEDEALKWFSERLFIRKLNLRHNGQEFKIEKRLSRQAKNRALKSVDRLVKTAWEIAHEKGKTQLSKDDLERSYQKNYGTVYPFC